MTRKKEPPVFLEEDDTLTITPGKMFTILTETTEVQVGVNFKEALIINKVHYTELNIAAGKWSDLMKLGVIPQIKEALEVIIMERRAAIRLLEEWVQGVK